MEEIWSKKYEPKCFDDLIENDSFLNSSLKKLAESLSIPHLILYGPIGVGKKVRARCIIHHLYDISFEEIYPSYFTFTERKEENEIENEIEYKMKFKYSSCHLEVDPIDAHKRDRQMIQGLIKKFSGAKLLTGVNQTKHHNRDLQFKVIMIHNVDKLSKSAQESLRATMEKHTPTVRFIFCVREYSRIIQPLQSRCLSLRVPAPSSKQICNVLRFICEKEKINPQSILLDNIASYSGGNLRKAILCLEAIFQSNPSEFQQQTSFKLMDWEICLYDLAKDIIQTHDLSIVHRTKNRFFEFMEMGIEPSSIIKKITLHWLSMADETIKCKIVSLASYYEHQIKMKGNPVLYLEAYIISFMAEHEKFLSNSSEIKVTLNQIKYMDIISTMIEDMDLYNSLSNIIIPIHHIDKETFQIILRYIDEHYLLIEEDIKNSLLTSNKINDKFQPKEIEITITERKYCVEEEKLTSVYKLLTAADYLQINRLLNVLYNFLVELIKKHSISGIRKLFGLTDDHSIAKKIKIQNENSFTEYLNPTLTGKEEFLNTLALKK